MLDYRYQTFLTLTEEMSYTLTAQKLHITQPAVTQHIQFLQHELGVELLHYENRRLTLTPKGKQLQKDLYLLQREIKKVQEQLTSIEVQPSLSFGASLTISEYMMPDLIATYLTKYPNHKISMVTGNTQNLIELLEHGKIDFALIEGEFNQDSFAFHQISDEPFIGICGAENKIGHSEQKMQDLFSEPLLLRENGSGSRLIFETALKNKGIHLDSFNKVMPIGNIGAIKKLVQRNVGITFIYQKAVEDELKQGILKKIPLQDFNIKRPFHLIYLNRKNLKQSETLQLFMELIE